MCCGSIAGMGYPRFRVAVTGRTHWNAIYLDQHGRERCAGRHPSKREVGRLGQETNPDADARHGTDLWRPETIFTGYVITAWLGHVPFDA